MQTIRSLRQPGPPHPRRIDCARGDLEAMRYELPAGATLNEAVTGPLVKAGFQCGSITFSQLEIDPFRYVMPGPASDNSHVAYFTAPKAPVGVTRIEQGAATFGWTDGSPSIHCHSVWIEPDG